MPTTTPERVNGHTPQQATASTTSETDTKTNTETKPETESGADLLAKEEAEKQRIANERARLKLEKDKAAHERHIAEQKKKTAEADAAAKKAREQEAAQAAADAEREAAQARSEHMWKWGARGIYIVGLIIAAPIQFLHFWDPARKFMIAAPVLLEGLALVLAMGAAWAVAHRRDVAPYRVGIMIGALIAAAINLYGGLSDAAIGLNAGIIGAIASLGGPIVLMAYEHGIAQKADGIPSYRERRAVKKQEAERARKRAAEKAERKRAAQAAADAKRERDMLARADQERKDKGRQEHHPEVWKVAESLRSARGAQYVTEQIWGDAWYLVTGSKKVGITPEIELGARAAQERMKAASDDPNALIDSQKGARAKRDPGVPDGRRFNRGTPPRRTPGDTQPYTPIAKTQAALEQTEGRS